MRLLALASLATLITGCAAGNIQDIKQDAGDISQILVHENYQRVYKNILENMQECLGEGWAGAFAQYHIQHELYSELREANISYMMSNLGTQGYYLHIDIKGLEDSTTQVDSYTYFSTWKSWHEKIATWAVTPGDAC